MPYRIKLCNHAIRTPQNCGPLLVKLPAQPISFTIILLLRLSATDHLSMAGQPLRITLCGFFGYTAVQTIA